MSALTYCMSKKPWHMLYRNLLYEMGQNFSNTQYLILSQSKKLTFFVENDNTISFSFFPRIDDWYISIGRNKLCNKIK